MDYITKLNKETDPSIYKYRLLNLINNWGRLTLFTGKSMKDTYITKELKTTNGLDFRLLIIKLEEELERLSREYRDEFNKL